MCVLVIGVRWYDDLPLVVAANRDEEYARPACVPEVEQLQDRSVLRPLDERAGGTWEGTNSQGLLAVITNRRDGSFAAERRSRGLLCREVLELADTATVESFVEQALRSESYNSFNLLYADRRRVCLSSWNGRLETQVLGPGTHVLSNEHGLGELLAGREVEIGEDDLPGAEKVTRRVLEAIANHKFDGETPGLLTASAGTACFPNDGSTAKEIIASADKALYQAKRSGKNTVRTTENLVLDPTD